MASHSAIQKVAVLGAGVMGQGISAHLANAGVASLLYDIAPKDGADGHAIAKAGIANIAKLKPPALFQSSGADFITPCSYDLDASRLAECDLVIEVVAEVLAIKEKVFSWVASNRRPGCIVASNTSGIPLAVLVANLTRELRNHFVIRRFFNPVRYMQLLEIVSGPDTLPDLRISPYRSFNYSEIGEGADVRETLDAPEDGSEAQSVHKHWVKRSEARTGEGDYDTRAST
jgi:3-hydroxyacyl-CoA dehydrogenase